jgi:hypothetical protein
MRIQRNFIPLLVLLLLSSAQSRGQAANNQGIVYIGTSDPDDKEAIDRCREKFYPQLSLKEGAGAGLYIPLPVIYNFRHKEVRFGTGISYDIEWRVLRPGCSSLGRMTLKAKPDNGWQLGFVVSASPVFESSVTTKQTVREIIQTDPQTGEPSTTTSNLPPETTTKINPMLNFGVGFRATYNLRTDLGIRRLSLGAYLGWQLNISTGEGSLFAGPILSIR